MPKIKIKRNNPIADALAQPLAFISNQGRDPLNQLMQGEYNSQERVFRPVKRVRGKVGDEQLLSRQVAGGSVSGGKLPGWRRFRVERMKAMQGVVVKKK